VARDEAGLQVESTATEDEFRTLFSLDETTEQSIERLGLLDPAMGERVRRLPGLRLMRPSCPVESAFCFLTTSNNHLARIHQMVRAMASYGDPLSGAPSEAKRFPPLERIAALTEEDLRNHGFGYRARTIPLAANRILENGGKEWLRSLAKAPYEEAHRALTGLPGVGNKLADCIALFALGHGSAVPVDTHVWQAMTRDVFPDWRGKSLTDQRYRAIGDYFREKFGELAGMAHQFVFVEAMLSSKSKQGRERRPGPPVSPRRGSLPRP
jgi:N-glycosylase/DNA lyase